MLCSNRYPLPGSPSTCLLDTVLVPLPSFIFVVAFSAVLYYQHSRPLSRTSSRKWIYIVYLVLVVCNWAMTILELVRLGLEGLGVGLLPVTTICLTYAFVVLLKERYGTTRVVSMVLVSYWFLLSIMEIIKTVRLHKLEVLHPTTMQNSKYPSSDQFLDNAVMMVLYILFFIYEAVLLFKSRHASPANLKPLKLQGV